MLSVTAGIVSVSEGVNNFSPNFTQYLEKAHCPCSKYLLALPHFIIYRLFISNWQKQICENRQLLVGAFLVFWGSLTTFES